MGLGLSPGAAGDGENTGGRGGGLGLSWLVMDY